MTELEKKLKAPFPEKEIEWRCARAGKSSNGEWAQVLAYVQSMPVQDRLDAVCTPAGWRNDVLITDRGVLQTLSIKIGDEWITRTDGADYTDFEAFKGGISGAFKRVASLWGIGRYLYDLEATYVTPNAHGKYRADYKDKDGQKHFFKWNPPDLPKWAVPVDDGRDGDVELREAKIKMSDKLNGADAKNYLPDMIERYRLEVQSAETIDRLDQLYQEIKTYIKAKKKEEKATVKDEFVDDIPPAKNGKAEMLAKIDGLKKGVEPDEAEAEKQLDIF